MEADDSIRDPGKVPTLIVLLFGFMVGVVVTHTYHAREIGDCHHVAFRQSNVTDTARALEFAKCMSPRKYNVAG